MEIQIQNRQRSIKLSIAPLRDFLSRLLDSLNITQEQELSVVLVSDAQIARLNKQYRHKIGATDVLAFAMREGDDSRFTQQQLGDVVISVETAKRQAEEEKHSLICELKILIVHGVLHLLGYDHIDASDAEKMKQMETVLLEHIKH